MTEPLATGVLHEYSGHRTNSRENHWMLKHLKYYWFVLFSMGLFAAPANAKKDLYTKKNDVRIAKADFFVSLWPNKHLLRVRATLSLSGPRIPKKLRLYLPQLIRLKSVAVRRGTSWKKIRHIRQLETVQLLFATRPKKTTVVQMNYTIVFDSSKNYLFRGIFCQLEPGDSYFLYGWYPSSRPFADPLSGQLLKGHRWNYRLTLEVPSNERPVSAGPLLKVQKVGRRRKRYVFGSSPIKEAALFFASGRYSTYRYNYSRAMQVRFYLHRRDSRRHLGSLGKIIRKVQRFYSELWGDPRGPEPRKNGKQGRHPKVTWQLISFGGSGARGYPFTLLLDRRENFFNGRLQKGIDRLFSKRQVLLHEMAHTWWGNAVTGVGQGSIWLNEGLANYASIRALGELYGEDVESKAIRRHIQYFLDGRGSGRLLEPGGLAQMAQRTAYTKGALVFFELERWLGRSVLDAGLRLFFQKYRGKYANINELQKALEKAAKRSLGSFFRQWIRGRGLPMISMRKSSIQKSKNGYRVVLSLENTGQVDGMAHIRVRGVQKSHNLWVQVPAQKTLRYVWKHSRKVRSLKFNPDRLMLHGFRWRSTLRQANALRKEKRWQKASRLFRGLVRDYPQHGHALYSWGRLFEVRRRWGKAIKLYRRAARCKPSTRTPNWVLLWARFREASLLQKQGRHKQSRKLFENLLRSRANPYGLHERIQKLLQKK